MTTRGDATPVLILDRMSASPVFHAWGTVEAGTRDSEPDDDYYGPDIIRRFSVNTTGCGIEWARREWSVNRGEAWTRPLPGSYKSSEHGLYLRRDQAVKFGRPCKRCHRGGKVG